MKWCIVGFDPQTSILALEYACVKECTVPSKGFDIKEAA